MTVTHDIVARLWNLCHVLRDDGITYHQYVTELTYLLFLKMAQETNTEGQIPEGWRWKDLESRDGLDQLTYYRRLLRGKAVLRVDPHAAPASPDQSPAPRCHGATREARDRFRAGYALFVQLYREAMECLVRGVDEPIVPDGGVLPWALRPAPS